MTTATQPTRQYLLLRNVSWDEFRSFARMVDDEPGHRLTCDQGSGRGEATRRDDRFNADD